MSRKKAVVDENNDVQNVIIADDDFKHPDYQLQEAEGKSVSSGDYWNGEEYITPLLNISGDDAVINDGNDTASITIQQTTRKTVTFDLVVAGEFIETISITPSEQHREEFTTTANAGTDIIVEILPGHERLDKRKHKIEVMKA